MKLDKVKPAKTKLPGNKNLIKKILAVVMSVAVFVISFMVINNANKAAKDVIAVLQVKSGPGIPEHGVYTKENVGSYDIIRKEYADDMVLAEDIDKVIDQYATHYMRKGSVIHNDEIMTEKPLKNEWIYRMSDEEEVLTIPYNYLESGGDILTPGDRIRVRVTYEEVLPPKEDPEATQNPNYSFAGGEQVTVTRTETLFQSVVVMDMLNSSSHSIYEVYRQVLRLPEDQRQEVLKSPDFIKSIVPKSLVVAANDDEITKYAAYKKAEGSKLLLVTILQRQENAIILDQLPTLQKEIEMWLEKQKNS